MIQILPICSLPNVSVLSRMPLDQKIAPVLFLATLAVITTHHLVKTLLFAQSTLSSPLHVSRTVLFLAAFVVFFVSQNLSGLFGSRSWSRLALGLRRSSSLPLKLLLFTLNLCPQITDGSGPQNPSKTKTPFVKTVHSSLSKEHQTRKSDSLSLCISHQKRCRT